MSLLTHSKFYFGYLVDTDNYNISFNEGGPELVAVMQLGAYTATEYAVEVARAMTEAGGQDYACAFSRTTRAMTISAAGNFQLNVSSSTYGSLAFDDMGFTGSDRTGDNDYTGSATGTEYATQFILQSYVSSEDNSRSVDATINRSASGRVEVFSFGQESFVEMNIKYLTDRQTDGNRIRYNAAGVAAIRALMNHLVLKYPVEFMANEAAPATFEKLILESTQEDSKGIGFKLREMYGEGLPFYFETGVLKMRVTE